MITDFPEFFHLFKEKKYTYNTIEQNNRNPLLFSYNFSDGLKTGYTEDSGFSLAATASKDNKRLILILSGMDSTKERKKEINDDDDEIKVIIKLIIIIMMMIIIMVTI